MPEVKRAPPRVTLVLDGAGYAGTERHVRSLMRSLPSFRYDLAVVTSKEGPLVEEARSAGLSHRLCPRRSGLEYVAALSALFRRTSPSLVHAHSGRLACLAARLAGVPVVLETRHGIPERLRRLYRSAPATTRWEGWKCGLARVTICVCHADAEWMAERAGVPRSRLRVIPNGVPLRAPGAPADPTERREAARRRRDLPLDRPVVGFLGRLAPQKAPHRFLETLAAVRKEADVLGVICGVGPLEPALRARAAEMGLLDHVRWMGEVADGRSLIAAFDLLLLPSTWEGAPYVVLEGLAEETPILATPVGGIPEILAGAPLDLSLADWSPGAWLDRTRSFLFDPALSAEWKRAARVRAERFREETMVASVDDLYRELMGA